MTQLASDNFSGTSLSTNWTQVGSSSVASGVVSASVTPNLAYYNAVAWPNDQYSEVGIPTGDSQSNFSGAAVRASGTTTANYTFYEFAVSGYEANTPQLEIAKVVSGTFTSLVDSGSTYYHISNGELAKLVVQGTSLKAYLGGTLVLSTTDSSIASGDAGIYIDSTASASVETWSGGSVASSSHHGGGFFFENYVPKPIDLALMPLLWISNRKRRVPQQERSWRRDKKSRLFLPGRRKAR